MLNLFTVHVRRGYPDVQDPKLNSHSKLNCILACIAADWGASYLPPRELYDTGIYQESIAVVAAGSLEQLIESISRRIQSANREQRTLS